MISFNPLIVSHSRASSKLVFCWISSLVLVVTPNEVRGVDWEVLETRLSCWLFVLLGSGVIVAGVI